MIIGTLKSINLKTIIVGLGLGSLLLLGVLKVYSESDHVKKTLIVSQYPYERVDELLGCDSFLDSDQRMQKLNDTYLNKKISVFNWQGEVIGAKDLSGGNVAAIDIDGNIKTTELFLRVGENKNIHSVIGRNVSFQFMLLGAIQVEPMLEGGCDMAFEGELI